MSTSIERLRERARDLLEQHRLGTAESDGAARLLDEMLLLQTELAIQQDELTESHRRLEALHARYHQLFECAPTGFVRISPGNAVEDVNVAARNLLGLAPSWQKAAVLFTAFLPASSMPSWRELTSRSGGAARIALLGARGVAVTEVRTVPWTAPEGGWLVMIDDVTALSEAVARQHEVEERLSHVVRTMSDALVVVDGATGIVEEHNDAFARLLGRQGESLTGSSHESFFAPEHRVLQDVIIRQAFRDGRSRARVHYATATGALRAADVTVGSVQERGRSLEYFVVRDMTEQLRVEEERRHIDARLAESQKLEALGLLAAGIAHDMNNVLAGVMAVAELPPSEELMGELRSSAMHGRELTERLLAVSRRRPLRSAPFDLLAVVEEAVALARRTFPRELEIAFERGEGPWILEGDSGQWHQALLNLLINARDALHGIGRIAVVAERGAGDHAIVVRDDGEGMTAEVLRHAFEPFFTTKTEGQGTGLGLAHVRAVVAAHGGTTTIESKPGVGTSVRLALAGVSAAALPKAEAPVPQSLPAAAPRAVLVVDDEPSIARGTARMLERSGWSATTASSAVAALRLLEERTFDVVLTDRSMPGVSGDRLVHAIRCRWPNVRVAVITGRADDDEVEALLALGVGAIIGKPFRMNELVSQLADLSAPPPLPQGLGPCGIPEKLFACDRLCPNRGARLPGAST